LPYSQDELQKLLVSCFSGLSDKTLTIRVVSNEESKLLNQTFRSIYKETNVLSFAYEPMNDHDDINHLGDIAIAYEVIVLEAQQQEKLLDSHFMHMVVHGLLHLQGFDHEQAKQAEVMEAKEVQILSQLGISNPYLPIESQQ